MQSVTILDMLHCKWKTSGAGIVIQEGLRLAVCCFWPLFLHQKLKKKKKSEESILFVGHLVHFFKCRTYDTATIEFLVH